MRSGSWKRFFGELLLAGRTFVSNSTKTAMFFGAWIFNVGRLLTRSEEGVAQVVHQEF